MGFTIYCILEACLLVANAIAILNERFLRQGKSKPDWPDTSRFPCRQHQWIVKLARRWQSRDQPEASDYHIPAHVQNLDAL